MDKKKTALPADSGTQSDGAGLDLGNFSFALHALGELQESGTSAVTGMPSAADSAAKTDNERISNLQSALDSYKDWLDSI